MLEVREKHVHGHKVIAPIGSLTSHDVPDLQQRLVEALVGSPTIILNLSELTYISSAGVALFVKIGNRARALGGALRLAHPQRTVRETLAILHLDSHELIFQVFATVEEALKS